MVAAVAVVVEASPAWRTSSLSSCGVTHPFQQTFRHPSMSTDRLGLGTRMGLLLTVAPPQIRLIGDSEKHFYTVTVLFGVIIELQIEP